jgi:hypothetical protein
VGTDCSDDDDDDDDDKEPDRLIVTELSPNRGTGVDDFSIVASFICRLVIGCTNTIGGHRI